VFWKEFDAYWRIEMSDGRSYYFRRLYPTKPRAAETAADFKPGVMTRSAGDVPFLAPGQKIHSAAAPKPTKHRKKKAETGEE